MRRRASRIISEDESIAVIREACESRRSVHQPVPQAISSTCPSGRNASSAAASSRPYGASESPGGLEVSSYSGARRW